MNTQSNVVAVVTVSAVDALNAQIAALKAQAKAAAKAEKVAARVAAKAAAKEAGALDKLHAQALKLNAKFDQKAVKAVARAAVKDLNKLHAEALKINAQFDKGVAELNKIEAAKMLQDAFDALVAQLAAVGLTVADFKRALPKLAVAKTETV